jgi:hypothetical protein
MPIKVMWGKEGPYAVADTPEEAVALLKLSSNGTKPATNGQTPDTDVSNIVKLFHAVNDNAVIFLAALSTHKDGVRGDVLSEETKITSDKLGGIIGGVSKLANKFYVPVSEIVISMQKIDGTERVRYFKPGVGLLKYEGELRRRFNEIIK